MRELEDAIRRHLQLLEVFGNKHDVDGTGIPEQSMVAGWVLVIGQVGFADGQEFHAAIVEMPDTENTFHAIGLIDYARRFLANETADYLS
ncbi:hypothetical protein AB0P19_02255 [Microbacterium oleivorans]|uniref:hypothetical protein n=1 Tax=Microbacterium oleivorans TaxID=273677 RepID=UPI00341C601E